MSAHMQLSRGSQKSIVQYGKIGWQKVAGVLTRRLSEMHRTSPVLDGMANWPAELTAPTPNGRRCKSAGIVRFGTLRTELAKLAKLADGLASWLAGWHAIAIERRNRKPKFALPKLCRSIYAYLSSLAGWQHR